LELIEAPPFFSSIGGAVIVALEEDDMEDIKDLGAAEVVVARVGGALIVADPPASRAAPLLGLTPAPAAPLRPDCPGAALFLTTGWKFKAAFLAVSAASFSAFSAC